MFSLLFFFVFLTPIAVHVFRNNLISYLGFVRTSHHDHGNDGLLNHDQAERGYGQISGNVFGRPLLEDANVSHVFLIYARLLKLIVLCY